MNYGGLEHLVMFFDLDCRFDILRLSQSLKHQILEVNGELYPNLLVLFGSSQSSSIFIEVIL